MVEAGIIALAILVVGIAGIFCYAGQQEANRKRLDHTVRQAVVDVRSSLGLQTDATVAQTKVTHDFLQSNRILMSNLGPLCSGLAESLTARMSTIDHDMADLRTRVERATGTSTLSL